MTILFEYFLSCDNPIGDGYCRMRSATLPTMEMAVAYAREDGWTHTKDYIDICPHCNGNDR